MSALSDEQQTIVDAPLEPMSITSRVLAAARHVLPFTV